MSRESKFQVPSQSDSTFQENRVQNHEKQYKNFCSNEIGLSPATLSHHYKSQRLMIQTSNQRGLLGQNKNFQSLIFFHTPDEFHLFR